MEREMEGERGGEKREYDRAQDEEREEIVEGGREEGREGGRENAPSLTKVGPSFSRTTRRSRASSASLLKSVPWVKPFTARGRREKERVRRV